MSKYKIFKDRILELTSKIPECLGYIPDKLISFTRLIPENLIRSSPTHLREVSDLKREFKNQIGAARKETTAAKQRITGLEKKLLTERISWREKEEKLEEELRKRRKVFQDWKMCTLYLNTKGVIVDVEPKDPPLATRIFGADLEDIIGRRPTQLVPEEEYFNRYAGMVVEIAPEVAITGGSFEQNTIKIGDEALDIMAYPDWTGGGLKSFKGSIITLVPLRSTFPSKLKEWAGKLRILKKVIEVDEKVTRKKAIEYGLTMMRSGTRPIYFDFGKNTSISPKALEILSKSYRFYQTQGAICVFTNVPKDLAKSLHSSFGIEKKHIKETLPETGYGLSTEIPLI